MRQKILYALLFMGCFAPHVLFGDPPQKILRVWHFSIDSELTPEIEKQFEAKYPNIDVQLQHLSWDYGFDKIVTSLIAKNEPDVFEIGSTWGPRFSQSGVLKELTQDLKPLKNDYLMWDPVVHEDRIYGMPWLVGTRFLLYNKDLFQKANLDPNHPPKTWSELLYTAGEIQKLGPKIYGYGIPVAEDFAPWQAFIPYLWNGGGDVLTPDLKQSALDSKAAQNALRFYVQLKQHALVDRQEQLDQLFAQGKLGLILSGAWNFKSIEKNNPNLNYGVALVPTPTEHQTPISFGGAEMLVVSKHTKSPEAAVAFIQYLTSYEVSLAISKSQKNVLPALKRALNDPFFQSDPRFQMFAKQMLFTRTTPAHPGFFEVEKTLSSMVDQILLEDMPVEKAQLKAHTKINQHLIVPERKEAFTDQALFLWMGVGLFLMVGLLILFRNRSISLGAASSWIFVSPWVILFLAFSLFPLLYAFMISFTDYHVLSSSFSFRGLLNYVEVLKNPDFLHAVFNTLVFAMGTIPFTLVIALVLAVLIHQGVPWKSFFQAGFFLPVVTSIIVIATLFTYFYAENGFLNTLLTFLGLPRPAPAWLVNRDVALYSIMAMAVWSSSGYYMILFLAALQAIPKELYEASRLDGANSIQQFFKITLPSLRPMILFVVVINTINSLQVFPEIFTMTRGGPARSTTTIVYYLYEKGFSEFQIGSASAISYLLAILIGIFAYIQMKVLKERA